MPEGEFALQVLYCAVHGFHQDQKVVQQVRGFINEATAIAIYGLYDCFCGFFPNLL